MKVSKDVAKLQRELKALRNFPVNTTPVTRHLEIMADSLAIGDGYSMFCDDPEHCAVTMYTALIGYYEAKAEAKKARQIVEDLLGLELGSGERALAFLHEEKL